jgi:hypothetical protein
MIVYIMPIAQGYARSVLEAKKLLKFRTLSFLISFVIGISLGGYLSYIYAELGMIIGLVIPLFLFQWIVMNMYYAHKIKLEIFSFFKRLAGVLIFFTLEIIVFYIIFKEFPVSWLNFVFKALVYSAVTLPVCYLIMNSYERKLISSKLS